MSLFFKNWICNYLQKYRLIRHLQTFCTCRFLLHQLEEEFSIFGKVRAQKWWHYTTQTTLISSTGTTSFERTGEILGQLLHASLLWNVRTQISLCSASQLSKQVTAILYVSFAFIRVWGLALRCLTLRVSWQEFRGRIFLKIFSQF
jgi:hypothetical protein